MTNQQGAPEALRLAEEITELMCSNEAAARKIAAAADELCRLHVENKRLAALVEAQQPACGNTPYDEGPFTLAPEAPRGTAADGKTELFNVTGYPLMVRAVDFNRLHAENERLAAIVEALQPATHVQKTAEIEHVSGDVSKTGPESNMAQQPATSEQQPFGWIKQSEIDSSNAFGGSINLWRRQYDCDVPVYLAPQPSATPQTDSQPAHQRGTGYPPLPATYYLAGGVVRTWDEGQMRAYVDAYRTARAPADSVPVARFDDPKVQAAYAILCSDVQPPEGEHWEGFAARRIVDALSADSVLEDAARYRWLRDPTTDVALVVDKRTGYVPVGGYYTYEYRSGDELDAAVDAARKQGANHD